MRLSERTAQLRKQYRQCGGTGVYEDQEICDEPLPCHDLVRIHRRVLILPFFTAWGLIALTVFQTWQIANGKIIGALMCSFGISMVWSSNVKTIAGGGWKQRLAYCFGGVFGTGTGFILSKVLY